MTRVFADAPRLAACARRGNNGPERCIRNVAQFVEGHDFSRTEKAPQSDRLQPLRSHLSSCVIPAVRKSLLIAQISSLEPICAFSQRLWCPKNALCGSQGPYSLAALCLRRIVDDIGRQTAAAPKGPEEYSPGLKPWVAINKVKPSPVGTAQNREGHDCSRVDQRPKNRPASGQGGILSVMEILRQLTTGSQCLNGRQPT